MKLVVAVDSADRHVKIISLRALDRNTTKRNVNIFVGRGKPNNHDRSEQFRNFEFIKY